MFALTRTIFVEGLIGRVKLGYVLWISKMTKRKQSFSFPETVSARKRSQGPGDSVLDLFAIYARFSCVCQNLDTHQKLKFCEL
jgi:hypothetical protein